MLKLIQTIPSKICIWLIRFYQLAISPVLHLFGGGCRFFPTCSEYTLLCIKHHGAIKGIILGGCRILRCKQFCSGGLDIPPKKFEIKKLFSQNSVDVFNDFDKKSHL
ncbi:MAG: membrane protein insertion efficiency factor YidD [Opitutales bacterium]|nr:membrane protein insertion efficiency factor YidD [Opitutales bacterium]